MVIGHCFVSQTRGVLAPTQHCGTVDETDTILRRLFHGLLLYHIAPTHSVV